MALSYQEKRDLMLAARVHIKSTARKDGKPYSPRATITADKLRKAIPGSMGQYSRIAKRIGCHHRSLMRKVRLPDFQWALELIEQEREKLIDDAEDTVHDMLLQREEFNTALSAARLVLQTRGKGRGWQKETVLSGGRKPIQVEQSTAHSIDVEALPLELRRALLDTVDPPTRSRIRITKREKL